MKFGRLLPLFLLTFWLFGCSNFTRLQKSQDLDKKHAGAMQYFEKKDYYRAGVLLEEILPLLKGTDKAEKAQFYYAYCQYYERQYQLAAFYFKTFYETFPRSEYAEESAYMEALSYYEDSPIYDLDQENTHAAITAIQTFINEHPTSDRLEDCNFMYEKLRDKLEKKNYEVAKLYHRKADYQAAIIAFENFRRDFPESEMNEEALYLRVNSAYRLARQSIPDKQPERYGQVVTIYESFVDRYPQSKYLKEAEQDYAAAQAWLQRRKDASATAVKSQIEDGTSIQNKN